KDNCREIPMPDELADQAQEYREKLMDEVAENSDALMERYLEGEEISHEEIVDDLPSPVQHGGLELADMTLEPTEDGETFAYVFKTRADPFAGRINLF